MRVFKLICGVTGFLFCVSAQAATCEQEIMLLCPSGYMDGCMMSWSDAGQRVFKDHVCVGEQPDEHSRTVSCDEDVALNCPQGEIDACDMQRPAAIRHFCVLAR